jgi:hypothetical protein
MRTALYSFFGQASAARKVSREPTIPFKVFFPPVNCCEKERSTREHNELDTHLALRSSARAPNLLVKR